MWRLILLLVFCSPAFGQSVSAIYQPLQQVRDPELRQVQMDWRANRLLEDLTEQLSRKFALRQPLAIGLGECGQSNAFYRSDRRMIYICLELIPDLVGRVAKERDRDGSVSREVMVSTVAGALVFVVLHEMGHAVIDIQNLPVLGREEDAADMISTFLILDDPELASRAVAGGLWFFSRQRLIPNFFSQRHLTGEHSLDPQRAANLACWAYGRDPQRYAWAMQAAKVTSQRAARCAGEYEQLSRSVRELLRDTLR